MLASQEMTLDGAAFDVDHISDFRLANKPQLKAILSTLGKLKGQDLNIRLNKPKKHPSQRVTTQNILTESRSKLKVVIVLKREEDDAEDIEGDAAASIRIMSTALLSAAQCSICQDILEDASSLSTGGHTFCKDCIHDTVATGKKNCCPTCKVFAWARDVMPSRRVETLLALTSE